MGAPDALADGQVNCSLEQIKNNLARSGDGSGRRGPHAIDPLHEGQRRGSGVLVAAGLEAEDVEPALAGVHLDGDARVPVADRRHDPAERRGATLRRLLDPSYSRSAVEPVVHQRAAAWLPGGVRL